MLARLKELGFGPVMSTRREARAARSMIEMFNIKTASDRLEVSSLSGGNQQKVVLGKWFLTEPGILLLDEPTRGVDVGAIAEIHQLINRLADEGIAVMVISSYLPEVLQLSDRILVCRQGRIVEEFEGHKADEETIMYAAVH